MKISKKEYDKKHYRDNREHILLMQKMRIARQRNEALDILGGVCVHCGIDDRRVLEFHHINGKNDRRRDMHKLLMEIKAGEEIIILCANCHSILHFEERYNSH